jgi:hypothetical protein
MSVLMMRRLSGLVANVRRTDSSGVKVVKACRVAAEVGRSSASTSGDRVSCSRGLRLECDGDERGCWGMKELSPAGCVLSWGRDDAWRGSREEEGIGGCS